MRKITISEVAAQAGVSRATADRVLNRRGGVSVEKARAVLVSARALGLDRNLDMSSARMLRVCVLMQPPANPFYERLGRGFRQANLIFQPQRIRAYITHIDVLATETIRLQLLTIARTYDALVIVAPARESIVDTLRSVAARIPVVTLSTDLPLNTAHYYVGPDNYKAGRLAAELMGRMLSPAGGRVLLIAGLQAFSGHGERRQGFLDVLEQDFRNCTIAIEIGCMDQGAMVAERVASALLQDPQIRGIYNISQGNDVITRCVRQHGIRKELIVICHDLTPTTIKLLLAREIQAVIGQDPMLEAKRAIELILQHHGRLDAPSLSGSTPLHVHFRENAHVEIL